MQGVIYKTFTKYTVREIFSAKRAEIQSMLEEQKALAAQLDQEYRDYIERQEAAAAAAAAAEADAASDTGTSGGGTTTGGGGGYTPPPDASAAQIANDTARAEPASHDAFGNRRRSV